MCGETVGEEGKKEKQWIFHYLREIINATQHQQKVRFCLNHKQLNKAESTDETLWPALYRR